MDFKNLWVGDLVFVSSLGINVKWEDLVDESHAKVKNGCDILVVSLDDLAEAKKDPQKTKALRDLEDELKEEGISKPKKQVDHNQNTIDLHIEKLNPSLTHQNVNMIVTHQIMRCQLFVQDAVDRRAMMITIIHGKGNGTLKAEVQEILKSHPEIYQTHEKHNGGATEAWFQY